MCHATACGRYRDASAVFEMVSPALIATSTIRKSDVRSPNRACRFELLSCRWSWWRLPSAWLWVAPPQHARLAGNEAADQTQALA